MTFMSADRTEQLKKYRAISSVEDARLFCLNDLFFLFVVVLGRKDANHDWIYDRCKMVQEQPDGYLDLWSRGHYKSSIITCARTIQDVLANPEITVGIFSINKAIARGFLRQIKREFETNERLKQLFPDVLWGDPRKEAPKWTEQDGITVKRKGNPKEATIEANGLIDSLPTSRHYDLLVYDDPIDQRNVTTEAQFKKVVESWELSLNLSKISGSRFRYIGTRYHMNDLYATIIERKAAIPRIFPATDNGRFDGNPVLLSREEFQKKVKEMGRYTASAQLLQNPLADTSLGFDVRDLRFWPAVEHDFLNKAILVDPAHSKKEGSDYTAMVVVGKGHDDNLYVVDIIRDRLNLRERVGCLFDLHRRYKPYLVAYERYGLQADIEYVKEEQNRRNYRFDIKEVGGQTRKTDRILRLLPLVEEHRLYLPTKIPYVTLAGKEIDLTRALIQEFEHFPFGEHDDMLDALARVFDVKLPSAREQQVKRKIAAKWRRRKYNPLEVRV